MNNVTRKYHGKDVDMVIAAYTIIEAAIRNKTFLQSKRSNWQDPYFDLIREEIDEVTRTCLGADNAGVLRSATQAITRLQKNATTLLAEVKVQIAEDFKNDKARRDEILNLLGFKGYYANAQRGNQEALVQLLFRFKVNLSSDLMNEIVAKGTDADVLIRIMEYAETSQQAEITQEASKGNRKVLTGANIEALNNVYEKVVSICKIASKFFKEQPNVKSQFSFEKVMKMQSAYSKSKTVTETPAA